MKNKSIIMAAAVAALVSFASSVQAIPITGTVIIQGGTTLTPAGSPLGTATGVAATIGNVLAGNGSFSGTAGSAVTFNAFTFNPSSAPVNPLWTFVSGGLTYSFNLASLVVNTQNANFLDISGLGMLTKTGFDATPGTWSYQINTTSQNGVGGVFSYQSSNTSVPDGGLTVMLLGVALSSLCLFRKKIMA